MFLFDWVNFGNNIPEDCVSTRWSCDWPSVSISICCINYWKQFAVRNFFDFRICQLIKQKRFEKVIYDLLGLKVYRLIILFGVKNYSHSSITMVSSILIKWSMNCMHFKIILLSSNFMLRFWMKMELESLKLSFFSLHVFTAILRHKEVWHVRFFVFHCRQKNLGSVSNPFNYRIQRVLISFNKIVFWITYSVDFYVSTKSW